MIHDIALALITDHGDDAEQFVIDKLETAKGWQSVVAWSDIGMAVKAMRGETVQ